MGACKVTHEQVVLGTVFDAREVALVAHEVHRSIPSQIDSGALVVSQTRTARIPLRVVNFYCLGSATIDLLTRAATPDWAVALATGGLHDSRRRHGAFNDRPPYDCFTFETGHLAIGDEPAASDRLRSGRAGTLA